MWLEEYGGASRSAVVLFSDFLKSQSWIVLEVPTEREHFLTEEGATYCR